MEELDGEWDQIDWDEKIIKERHPESLTPKNIEYKFSYDDEENENYYEINQNRKKEQKSSSKSAPKIKKQYESKEELPYSYTDLCRIRSYDDEKQFNAKLIYETYGEFSKFLLTHAQKEISDESLVELIKIDVALLEVPFIYHNHLLLNKISTIPSFWHQIIDLIDNFFEKNCKDPKYLLLIDMKGLFEGMESLLFWMIANNCMNHEMEEIYLLLIKTVNKNVGSTYINVKKFHQVLEDMEGLSSELNLFDVSKLSYN